MEKPVDENTETQVEQATEDRPSPYKRVMADIRDRYTIVRSVVVRKARKLRSIVMAYPRWLAEMRKLWWTVGVILAVGVLVMIFTRDPLIWSRLTGWVLQLLGTGMILWKAINTYDAHSKSTLRTQFKEWLQRRPGRSRVIGASFTAIPVTVFGGKVRAGYGLKGAGRSNEERLLEIERQFMRLAEEVLKLDSRLDKEVGRLGGLIDKEKADRMAGDDEMSGRLKALAIGSIHLDLMGVVWLLVGLLVTFTGDLFLS